jgi:ABC-type transport system substrate-binding protein
VAAAIGTLAEAMEQRGLPVRPARGGGVLPPAMPGHTRQMHDPITLDRARELLAEAGYPGGEGLPDLRLVMHHPLHDFAGVVEEALAAIGVSVELRWVSVGESLSMVKCDAWLSAWQADYPDPDGFFRGLLSPRHVDVLGDAELGRLLNEAHASRNRDDRLRLYGEVDRRLVMQALMVPVQYGRSVLLQREGFDGIWANALTRLRFDQATVAP